MYVGLDVHKDFCQAAFVNSDGKVIKEAAFKNNTSGLEKLAKAAMNAKVVMEASSSSMHVYDALSKTCDVKVAHPSKLRAIASARIKTDKLDSEILAQLLRADLIPESYVPSKEYRQARILVRHRTAIVRMRSRVKNKIHSLLTKEGIRYPSRSIFGKKGMVMLRDIVLDEMQRVSMDSMLSLLNALNAQISDADKRIEILASNDRYAKNLVTITGVGWFSALAISSEICDISRFPSHKHFCSYLGIVPSIHQSGNTEHRGHITKQGSSLLRWILIQDARIAVKYSPRFRKKYLKLKKRIGENKAIVAIARNLAVVMYFMLVRNEPYREQGRKSVRCRGHKDRYERLDPPLYTTRHHVP